MFADAACAPRYRPFRLRSLWPARPRHGRVKEDCFPLIHARLGVPHGA